MRSDRRAGDAGSARGARILWAALIVAATLVAYLPAVRGGYVWDDDAHITANPTLRTLDGLRRIWLEPRALPQYYPLVHTTFWIERHLWGLDPLGYHLVNVLLHALNALLLWRLLGRLSVRGAWFAAALFALHPVHVESVAWITERKNLLSGLLYLLAALALLRFFGIDASAPDPHRPLGEGAPRPDRQRGGAASKDSPVVARGGPSPGENGPPQTGAARWVDGVGDSPRRDRSPGRVVQQERDGRVPEPKAWGWYAAGCAFHLAALLSKTVTASLPVAVLIALWWKRDRLRWREVLPLAPMLAAGAALGGLTVWIEKHHVGAEGEIWALPLAGRILVAGRALWFYAGKLLWPSPLIFFYPRWSIDPAALRQWLFPLAAVAVLAALWILRRRIGRGPLAAALFFVVTLTPALGFFDVFPMRYSWVADHFQYLASAGLIAMAASLAASAAGRSDRAGSGAPTGPGERAPRAAADSAGRWAGSGAGAASDSGGKRAGLVVRPVAFSAGRRAGLVVRPVVVGAGLLVLLILGALTWRQGTIYRDAETLWRDTIAKNPSSWAAQNNLGLILARRGETAQAEVRYREALRLEPGFIEARNNLGSLLSRQGRNEEAAVQFAEAVRLKADYPVARLNLATALLKLNRNREAIEQLDELLRQEPELLPAHERRAAALEREGRAQEALAEQVEVLRLRAWIRATHEDGSIRNAGEAIRYASQACELTGSAQPRPLDALAAAYAEAGRFSDAVATARTALAFAQSAGQEELARGIRRRIESYEGGRPWRDPALGRTYGG